MSFPTKDYEAELARLATGEETKISANESVGADAFDLDLDAQVQTDKPAAKLVPCRECKRPLVVTTFFAPAKAICSTCSGTATSSVASVGQPVPGQTEPAKAVRLADVLVNRQFAHVVCPVDPAHDEMLLVNVTHNDHYGPSQLIGYKNGIPEYRQIAVGETTTHQCQTCLATVSFSTTPVVRMKPVNEPKQAPAGARGANSLADLIGVREPTEYPDYDKLRQDAEALREAEEAQPVAA